MRRVVSIIGAATLLVVSAGLAMAVPAPKITICHGAGQAGTTTYVTLTISENAVYGPGGHFNENGTVQAGHEQDYFGPCNVATPTPVPSVAATPTPEPSIVSTPTPEPEVTPTPDPVTPTPEPSVSGSVEPSVVPSIPDTSMSN